MGAKRDVCENAAAAREIAVSLGRGWMDGFRDASECEA